MINRKAIFDAARAAGADFNKPGSVALFDSTLDQLGVGNGGGLKRMSPAGLTLIKNAEGLELKAYQDTGGVWTIGYGHTGPDVKPGMAITPAQAEALLIEDIAEAEADVRRLFPITTQNQFDALASFTFNLGAGQVAESTLRRLHNEGDYAGAKAQFARWRFDNGRELKGLVARRAAEAQLYGRAA
jgi:lysozyme